MTQTRRELLKSAAATAVSAAVGPTIIRRTALAQGGRPGANDRILVGFVGVGGRARQLMEHIPPEQGKIVAIADFWGDKLQSCIDEKKASGLIKDGETWNAYSSDVEMYEKEKLDCVFVATQDFSRTLPSCRAVLAGLDVYAEKPLTAYIAEGRHLVNLVRKMNRVFQVGSQQRSMRLNEYGCRLVREGKLGKVKLVQGCNYPGPRAIPENLQAEPVPDTFNWDAWQGPTKYREFNRSLLGWMQWWDYSGGQMTNWGAHGLDQIQWAAGACETGPVALAPHPDGGGKVIFRYANGMEVRLELENNKGPLGGAIFRCEKGNLEVNRNHLKANPKELIADAPEPDPPEGPTWIARPHIANFFDCMRTRKRPNADVEIGHRSVSLCHLANITRELNRPLQWNPDREQFLGDDEANAKVARPRRKGYELPEA